MCGVVVLELRWTGHSSTPAIWLSGSMQMSMRKLSVHTILQLWCCCHVMYKFLYPSTRVRTSPSVSVRVRVSVSFTFGVTPLRILICMCPWLSCNDPSQGVYTYTCVSVTKQYKLVVAKGRQCSVAGKLTIGLVSCWPFVADSVV